MKEEKRKRWMENWHKRKGEKMEEGKRRKGKQPTGKVYKNNHPGCYILETSCLH